jgi:LysM repeat protein
MTRAPGGYQVGGGGEAPTSSGTSESNTAPDSSNSTEATTVESSNSTAAPAATTTQSASPADGTNIFNNLAGRDPDLIHTGETIKLANGKTHVVKAGETLGGIAAANGMKLDDLIKANGMNANLRGKNASGAYFSVSGPGGATQPTPGTTQISQPATTPKVEPTTGVGATETPNATLPSPDELAQLLHYADDGSDTKALVQKAIDHPETLTKAEIDSLNKFDASYNVDKDYKAKLSSPSPASVA